MYKVVKEFYKVHRLKSFPMPRILTEFLLTLVTTFSFQKLDGQAEDTLATLLSYLPRNKQNSEQTFQ